MIFLKFLGIILIFLSCVLFGFSYAKKFENKINLLKISCEFLNEILIKVKYEKMQTKYILNELKLNQKYKIIFDEKNCSDEGQVKIIEKSLECLNTGTQAQIEEILENNVKIINDLINKKEKDYKSKSVLYKKLGITVGLMICLILI